MLRTETLKIGRPKNEPELEKLTSERIRALQTAQNTTIQEKSRVEDGSGKERGKGRTHKRERRPTQEKAVILSSKRSKTTKKNSWVDKDLTIGHKKKCFEENGVV